MIPSQCCIVIPVYKPIANSFEKRAFRQCLRKFNARDIFIAVPISLDVSYYLRIAQRERAHFHIKTFEPKFFESISGYNQLLLNAEFYSQFSNYDYLLIYQLDAYVFEDDLDEWCQRSINYIGAPLPHDLAKSIEKGHNQKSIYKVTLDHVFNGGASLRKTQAFYNVLSSCGELIDALYKDGLNEDVIFSALLPNQPDISDIEALRFSFDIFPIDCYNRNGKQLPMLCHAWSKPPSPIGETGFDFWLYHIWRSRYYSYKVYLLFYRIIKKLHLS